MESAFEEKKKKNTLRSYVTESDMKELFVRKLRIGFLFF
jgi:hypothetical protein